MSRNARLIGAWSCVLLSSVALGFLATGCGAVNAYGKHLQSSFVSPPVPKKLDASVDETGLLLADVRLYGKGMLGEYGYQITSASITSADWPDTVITAGPFSGDLVVFQGLRPGTYNLVKLSGWRNNGANAEYVYPVLGPEAVKTVEVAAGGAMYLGKLNCGLLAKGKLNAEWVSDPATEAKAWGKLLNRYDDSSWTPVITRRIEATGAAAD